MSSRRAPVTPKFKKQPVAPPYISAFLRVTFLATRRRILDALMRAGFADLNYAHLAVFQYPPPERMRPSDLADRALMTKQAMNYLLNQLEAMGYIKRQSDSGRRVVFLTPRGKRVFETMWAELQKLETEWAAGLGRQRFEQLKESLRELASFDTSHLSAFDRRDTTK